MSKGVYGALIPEALAKQIDQAIAEGKYVSKSDFVRQAIRKLLENENQ